MRWVKPEVFLIAKTVVNNEQVARWLRHVGCNDEVTKKYSDSYTADMKTDAEKLIELAGRRCYMSFEPGLNPNVTKIREDIAEYLTNILKSGHGSVLEHPTFTFAIEGVSRVFTGEMNRHRAGVAISEGSMRYIRYNDIPIVDVPSIQPQPPKPINPNYETLEDPIYTQKVRTRSLIKAAAEYAETYYSKLIEVWKSTLEGKEFAGKKHITSMLRRIIPMGVATGGVWTFNVRSLRHMLTMRAAEAAEEEIALVAGKMLEIMMHEEPILFGDFKMQENGFYKPTYVKV